MTKIKNKILFVSFICFLATACMIQKPKNFYLLYDGKYTGIDTLIQINGYYYSEPKQGYYDLLSFYKDGMSIYMLIRDTTSRPCFDRREKWIMYRLSKNTDTNIQQQRAWFGRYAIKNGIITNQDIAYTPPGTSVFTRQFKILSRDSLQNISTGAIYVFHPLENRIDSMNWLFKEKWFYQK